MGGETEGWWEGKMQADKKVRESRKGRRRSGGIH